ncbi:EAL domain-containing protein, partial [Aliikangiella coralliicola]
ITHFTSWDGLQSDEFNRPGILSSNGYLYFGGTNGLDRFYPNIIEKSLFVRPPRVVGLNVANKKISIEEGGILEKSMLATSKVELGYDQTPFSFEFTSPQYVKPSEIEFRYRLLGLDDKWITAVPSVRQATYTNINSGTYKFELQVRDIRGSWNGKVTNIEVFIAPAWWATPLAKSMYSIFVILMLALVSLFYWKKQQKEKKVQQAIKENEERLKLSLWGSGYEFWDWNINSGEVSRSDEFRKIQIDCSKMSKSLNELASYIHPDDLEFVREKLTNHIAGNTKHFDTCYRIVDAKRGWRWIQDRGKVVAFNNDGSALRMSGTQRDITNIRERDAQFEMLGQAFKSTSDGVWIRDHEWRLVECNPAYERITGFSLSEKRNEVLWFPEIQEQPENLLQRIRMSIDEKGNWQGEAWSERKNNDPFPQKLSIDTLHDEKGNIRYYVGVFSDITFHKRTEEEFRKLANYDSLTGLPNRACLYDRLNQTIEKTKRDQGRFALFLIDVDNFKRINDSLGHSVGDILIRQVASRLVNCNKEGDTVARIGGDEFVIVMENVRTSTSIAAFSELLLKELNQPIFVRGQKLKLNFSVGVTLAPDDAIIAERLIRNADTAMYEAKKSVENSYRFYSVEFNERARKRLILENALRKSIDDETIELFYQPKVDLNSGRVDGVEALARWTHKELGFISPAEFIPLAEETGLIIPLGAQILKQAIKQTKKWVDENVMRGRTSINLSAHQFWNRNLASEISRLLQEENLDAKYIELEITESACMQDMEETKSQMTVLRELGMSLALDDFGTGYSSLAQLKALPFDTLKVDKSFVDNIELDHQDAKVVKAIIDIAKTMEMNVVIEGVESKLQCEYLWKNRAYIVQGFYFSRPVKANLMPELFRKTWHKEEYIGKLISNVTPLA